MCGGTSWSRPHAALTERNWKVSPTRRHYVAVRSARQTGAVKIEIATDDFLRAIPTETCAATPDSLDDLLAESVTHLVRPRTPAAAHVQLQDDSDFIGEILWADAAFIKMRSPDGSEVAIPKRRIQRVYSRDRAATTTLPTIMTPAAAELAANLS